MPNAAIQPTLHITPTGLLESLGIATLTCIYLFIMARSPSPRSDRWWLDDDAPKTLDSDRSSLEVQRGSSPCDDRTVNYGKSSTTPPSHVTPPPNSPSAAAKAQLAAAEAEFCKSFPGGWCTIPTSMEGLLCGFFAVINSMCAQYPELPCPTREELQAIFEEQAMEFAEVFDMDNTYDFSIDQVAAIVYRWGKPQGLNLRIGYVEEGNTPLLVSHPNEEWDVRVLWIHNDGRWNGGIGHFSGIRHFHDEVARSPPEDIETESLIRHRAMRDDMFEDDNDGVPMDLSSSLSEDTLVGYEDEETAQARALARFFHE